MASVTFSDVEISYPGASSPTVNGLSLTLADGEFLVLVGPSGCGKSTTLRALAGLEAVTGGTISIGDTDVTSLEPRERNIAMVFQDYALYPHLSVRENMGFALKLAKRPKEEIAARVEEAAEILGLTPYLDRKPKDLSGGQRQRVAMGRAIVRKPQVFLMDEPLSNLDAKLRVQTRAQIVKLQRDLGVTTLYVTHDQVEAMTMGDRVAVLNHGQIQQVDPPKVLYHQPANTFVAGFIGSPAMNLIATDSAIPGWDLTPPRPWSSGLTVGLRPEALRVVSESPAATEAPAAAGVQGTVTMVEELGSDSFAYVETPYGQLVARGAEPRIGAVVSIAPVADAHVHYFDTSTGQRIEDEALA